MSDHLFTLDIPFWEIAVRGTLIYLGLLVLMRAVLRRQAGSIGLGDMLFVALAAEAAQNSLAGQHNSIPAGLLLIGTVVCWNLALDLAAYHWRWAAWLLGGDPLPIVRDGKLVRHNLEKARITEDELMSQLRTQGVERLDQVRRAHVEAEGQISVIPADDPAADRRRLAELVARLEKAVAAAERPRRKKKRKSRGPAA